MTHTRWKRICLILVLALSVTVRGESRQKRDEFPSDLYDRVREVYKRLEIRNDETGALALADSIMTVRDTALNNYRWGYFFNYKATLLHHRGNYYLSKKYFQLAAAYADRFGDNSLMGYVLNNYSLLMVESRDTTASTAVLDRKIRIPDSPEGKKLVFADFSNRIYNALYKQDTAGARMALLDLSRLQIEIPHNDPVWIRAVGQYGDYYLQVGKLDRALSEYREGLSLSEKTVGKQDFLTGLFLLRMGDYFTRAGNPDSSLYYYKEAKHLFLGNNQPEKHNPFNYEAVFIESLTSLGKAFMQTNQADSAYIFSPVH
jgi:tetratricopeptide (TPR) repeat protein